MASKEDVVKLIVAKGDEIREMKASGPSKDEVMKHVEELQKLKQLYQVNAVLMYVKICKSYIMHLFSFSVWTCELAFNREVALVRLSRGGVCDIFWIIHTYSLFLY